MYTLRYTQMGNVHPKIPRWERYTLLYTQVGEIYPVIHPGGYGDTLRYTQVGMGHPKVYPWVGEIYPGLYPWVGEVYPGLYPWVGEVYPGMYYPTHPGVYASCTTLGTPSISPASTRVHGGPPGVPVLPR